MNITTRFNIGDRVLFLTENQMSPKKGTVRRINVYARKSETEIVYAIDGDKENGKLFSPSYSATESRVFANKDEFVNFTINLTASL